MPPTKGGIFSNTVGYHSRVSHNDRQSIDLLCNCHRSRLLYWIAEKNSKKITPFPKKIRKKLCSGCINHSRNRAKNRAYYAKRHSKLKIMRLCSHRCKVGVAKIQRPLSHCPMTSFVSLTVSRFGQINTVGS